MKDRFSSNKIFAIIFNFLAQCNIDSEVIKNYIKENLDEKSFIITRESVANVKS